jgi:hypothetical protein
MADQNSPGEQTAQAAQAENPVREFINVDTAENSRLNKGLSENIYEVKAPKKDR